MRVIVDAIMQLFAHTEERLESAGEARNGSGMFPKTTMPQAAIPTHDRLTSECFFRYLTRTLSFSLVLSRFSRW